MRRPPWSHERAPRILDRHRLRGNGIGPLAWASVWIPAKLTSMAYWDRPSAGGPPTTDHLTALDDNRGRRSHAFHADPKLATTGLQI